MSTEHDAATVRAGIEYLGDFTSGDVMGEAHEALGRLVEETRRLRADRDELAATRRRVPGDEGGPGREETYWLRAKASAAITHLRDIEDYARLCGGLPEGFNALRAERARQLHESITADLLNGKSSRPTTAERAVAAEAEVTRLRDALEAIAKATSYPADLLYWRP